MVAKLNTAGTLQSGGADGMHSGKKNAGLEGNDALLSLKIEKLDKISSNDKKTVYIYISLNHKIKPRISAEQLAFINAVLLD